MVITERIVKQIRLEFTPEESKQFALGGWFGLPPRTELSEGDSLALNWDEEELPYDFTVKLVDAGA